MNISMGIRVTPKIIFFTIIKEEVKKIEIITLDKILVPQIMTLEQQLTYIRTTFSTIIHQYKIAKAVLKKVDPYALNNSHIPRIQMEGVLAELLNAHTVEEYYIGDKNSFAKKINVKSTEMKSIFDGTTNFYEINEWEKFKNEERESIVAAIIGINLE